MTASSGMTQLVIISNLLSAKTAKSYSTLWLQGTLAYVCREDVLPHDDFLWKAILQIPYLAKCPLCTNGSSNDQHFGDKTESINNFYYMILYKRWILQIRLSIQPLTWKYFVILTNKISYLQISAIKRLLVGSAYLFYNLFTISKPF